MSSRSGVRREKSRLTDLIFLREPVLLELCLGEGKDGLSISERGERPGTEQGKSPRSPRSWPPPPCPLLKVRNPCWRSLATPFAHRVQSMQPLRNVGQGVNGEAVEAGVDGGR